MISRACRAPTRSTARGLAGAGSRRPRDTGEARARRRDASGRAPTSGSSRPRCTSSSRNSWPPVSRPPKRFGPPPARRRGSSACRTTSGRSSSGKWADLVIVDADPLADIRNTRRISAVLQGGRVVDRAAIRGSFESHGTPSPGATQSYSATRRRRGAASMIGQTMTSNHASRRRRVVLHTTPFRVTCVCVGGELRFARRAGHERVEHGAHRVAAPHAGLATLANLM